MKRQVLRWLRSAGSLLILTGLAGLAWCAMSLLRTHVYQEHESAALDREIRLAPVKAVPNTPERGALLGSVSIPRVGVSSIIVEGANSQDLARSVGHIPGTAEPGETGNVALAGHRDTFFRGLQNIRQRDDILLTTPTGAQLYEVESMRIVSPEDVYVLNDVGRPLLTLVTCYPFHYLGPAPKRFIVQAHPTAR
jgi:sortase A